MSTDEDSWYRRLESVELPAGETVKDLAEAVKVFLTKMAFLRLNDDERDRLKRLCNYWNVDEAWLGDWATMYQPLFLQGDYSHLLDWLDHPVKPVETSAHERSAYEARWAS